MVNVWPIKLCWILGAVILRVTGVDLDRPKKGLNLYLHGPLSQISHKNLVQRLSTGSFPTSESPVDERNRCRYTQKKKRHCACLRYLYCHSPQITQREGSRTLNTKARPPDVPEVRSPRCWLQNASLGRDWRDGRRQHRWSQHRLSSLRARDAQWWSRFSCILPRTIDKTSSTWCRHERSNHCYTALVTAWDKIFHTQHCHWQTYWWSSWNSPGPPLSRAVLWLQKGTWRHTHWGSVPHGRWIRWRFWRWTKGELTCPSR